MDYNAFITSIVDDIGNPSYSYYYVSGWVFDPSNLGQLNILLDTCFEIESLTDESGVVTGRVFDPDFTPFEQAIYKQMFECFYYSKESKSSLISVTSGVGGWTSITEGDRTISRSNLNEVAKTFRGLSSECKDSLSTLIHAYLRAKGGPAQVAGDDTIPDFYYSAKRSGWRFRE